MAACGGAAEPPRHAGADGVEALAGEARLSALPPPLLELIAARVDPDCRHGLRAACRASRAAANAAARALAPARHPALRRWLQAGAPGAGAGGSSRDGPAARQRAAEAASSGRRRGLQAPPPCLVAAVCSGFPNATKLILDDLAVAAACGPAATSLPAAAAAPSSAGSSCAGARRPRAARRAAAAAARQSAAAGQSAAPRPPAAGGGAGSPGAGGAESSSGWGSSSSCSSGGGGGSFYGCGLGRSASRSSLGSFSSQDQDSFPQLPASPRPSPAAAPCAREIASSGGGGGGGGGGRGGCECCCGGEGGACVLYAGPAAAVRPRAWLALQHLEMRFDALSNASARLLSASAPALRELALTAPPGRGRARCAARRLSALRHLPSLRALSCAPPLGPAALRALRGAAGGRLRALALARAPRHHWGAPSLVEVASLGGLTELTLACAAGRTLTHAAPLAALTGLRKLSIWIGSYHASPPWTSCPLPDLLPAAAALGGLTELRLLQGLRRSSGAAQIALFGVLRCLTDLGLHDTVVGPEELRALARCRALRSLAVTLFGVLRGLADLGLHVTVVGPEELRALARCRALRSLAADTIQLPGGAGSPPPPALPRLRRLRANALLLGPWRLADIAPWLASLGPLKETLGPMGYGVSLSLPALAGSRHLASLDLMLGSLRAAPAPASAPAGCWGGGGGGGGGREGGGGAGAGARAEAAAAWLSRLPALSRVSLLGAAGGLDAADPSASAELALLIARALASRGAPPPPAPPAAAQAPASPRGRGAAAPGAPRVEAVAWREEEAAALRRALPAIREAAPGVEVLICDEWAG